MTDETLADREALAKAIHDGPNAQKQYAEAGIAAHTWDSCRYQDQYLADADAGITAGFHRGPDSTDDERVARLMARATPLGYSAALALIEAETKMLAEANIAKLTGHDHVDRCCREHGTHVSPHRGCILR